MSAQGKTIAALLAIGIPTALLGVTIVWFASNPLAVIGILTAMIGGAMYLLTYTDHEQ